MSVTVTRPASTTASTAAARRRRRALGIPVTIAAALAVWAVGNVAGADYVITDSMGTARVDAVATAGTTLVLALLGWGVLALLERITRFGTRAWTVLAIVVAAASMIPVVLVDATTATRIALAAIHLVVAAVLIPAYVRVPR